MSRIGIDLGTSNSCAAVWDGRAARMIELGEGVNTILPSVITVAQDQVFIGQDAVDMGRRFPEYCFRHFKRKLGETFNDNEDHGHQVVRGPDGAAHFRGPESFTYSPAELTSYLIVELVKAANARMSPQDSVTGAVITVPADFNQTQRAAVMEAAKLAGLDNVELMHEPTAAALCYGFDAKKARRILVFDKGGGTLDLSAVSTGGGLVDVLTTNGIRDLGGSDFDERIAQYIVNLWRTEHGVDLSLKDAAMVRIMVEAESVKKRLSDKVETVFRVEDIDRDKDGVTQHINYPITREVFEELTRDLRERIIAACKAAISDLKRADPNFSARDFHDILLVGGMTRVPSIRALVKEFFGKDPKRESSPEQVVAMGAAIRAAILDGRKTDTSIVDLTPHAIAIETTDGTAAILVPRGTNYPFQDTFMLSNPDAGQTEISVRLLSGDGARASTCEIFWASDIEIPAGPAQSARLPLTVTIDAGGSYSAKCGDQTFGTSRGT